MIVGIENNIKHYNNSNGTWIHAMKDCCLLIATYKNNHLQFSSELTFIIIRLVRYHIILQYEWWISYIAKFQIV